MNYHPYIIFISLTSAALRIKHGCLWTNNYGGKYNNCKSDVNGSMAFATVTEEKETNKNEKRKILPPSNANLLQMQKESAILY